VKCRPSKNANARFDDNKKWRPITTVTGRTAYEEIAAKIIKGFRKGMARSGSSMGDITPMCCYVVK